MPKLQPLLDSISQPLECHSQSLPQGSLSFFWGVLDVSCGGSGTGQHVISSLWRFCCIPALTEGASATSVRRGSTASWFSHSTTAPTAPRTDRGERMSFPHPLGGLVTASWGDIACIQSLKVYQEGTDTTPFPHFLISKLLLCKQVGGETPIITRISSSFREKNPKYP